MNKYLFLFIIFYLCGCLLTHQDIKNDVERLNRHTKTKQSQKDISTAENFLRIDNTFRELRGEFEKLNSHVQKIYQQLENKQKQIQQLQNKKLQNKENNSADLFYKAEVLFKDKKWKAAIIKYAAYRKKYKKGEFYKQATFKIGKSFKQLGLNKETKIFFGELWESFPNSQEAKQAKELLNPSKK